MCTERKATGLFVLASLLFATMTQRLVTQISIENVYLPCLSIIYEFSVQILLCKVDIPTFSKVNKMYLKYVFQCQDR